MKIFFKVVYSLFYDLLCSIYQFFECFDEIRSSQASLGNSGILNWTCSVFSAITAASNLASGSVHIPTGNFLMTIVLLSVSSDSAISS